MGTAKQIFPAVVSAEPLYWDRRYIKNLRELRNYPNYWRVTDKKDYVDGPAGINAEFTREPNIWACELDTENNTDIILYNTVSSIEQLPDRGNNKVFRYNTPITALNYSHTDPIDAVSIEFDQNGRPILLFESIGNIYLRWYDPVQQSTVVDLLAAGRTPVATTDTYDRLKDSSNSERLLFYVKASDNNIYYRKQLDRYDTEYQVTSEPVDELIQVSKNLYGGMTVVYVIDNAGTPELKTLTALQAEGTVAINTDGTQEVDSGSVSTLTGNLSLFSLYDAVVKPAVEVEAGAYTPSAGTLNTFLIESLEKVLSTDDNLVLESKVLSATSGQINTFTIESSTIRLTPEVENKPLIPLSSTLNNFNMEDISITYTSEVESKPLVPLSSTLTTFSIG